MPAEYIDIFLRSFSDYWRYLSHEVLHPHWHNYFYWLIGISLFFWLLEILIPWRKNQPIIRQDFWLDGFYMFFNFFLFSLVGFYAISNVFTNAFNDFLALFGITNLVAVNIQSLAPGWQLLLMFLIKDFISWATHILLHRVPFLWEFHKVHHSVQQMGFAAHLRYHWMENVIYKSIQYLPLGMIGFGLDDFFLVNIISIAIGHFNHSNIAIPLGPLKYILNNPQMHIWHHARDLPPDRPYGMNYGISLSIWDYLFGTAYVPENGRDIPLGFPGVEQFPRKFAGQVLYPFIKPGKNNTLRFDQKEKVG